MKRISYAVLVIGMSWLFTAFPAFSQGDDGYIEDNSIFDKVLSTLQKKCAVPALLPTYLANEDETNPLYAILTEVNKNRYEIEIAFDPECNNAGACHFGSVTGEKSPGEPFSGKKVKLTNGISGYFTESECAANCSDATLSWEMRNYRYHVTLKAGSRKNLIEMANSAIENAP